MTLRELMHFEIWSKQTSRRILLGFAVFWLGAIILYALEIHLTSPTERKAGREALASIDKLRPLLNGNDEQFRIADSKANEKLEAAQRSSWTDRDKSINVLFSIYLNSIEHEAKYREISLISIPFEDEHRRRIRVDGTAKLLDIERQARDQMGQTLHRVLD